MAETASPQSATRAENREPVVGVIYNPRSHRNKGQDLDIAARPNVHVEQPETHQDIGAALDGLARKNIDFLIINGGDGTVRDVLTRGQEVFGANWPELAVLPKGKTNALNVDLGAPNGWTLPEAIEAYKNGNRIARRPISVVRLGKGAGGPQLEPGSGPAAEPMLGFILGGGAFTLGIQAGQDAHKLGAFNSLAVAATGVWGVAQALFGTDQNIWRRGTAIRFLLGPEREELQHGGRGDRGRRAIFLCSTLERFPAGLKIFGAGYAGLKLTVLDRPHRRVLAALPLVLAGAVPQWVKDRGFHQVQTDSFELHSEGEYILDGEAYPAGHFRVTQGPELSFVIP